MLVDRKKDWGWEQACSVFIHVKLGHPTVFYEKPEPDSCGTYSAGYNTPKIYNNIITPRGIWSRHPAWEQRRKKNPKTVQDACSSEPSQDQRETKGPGKSTLPRLGTTSSRATPHRTNNHRQTDTLIHNGKLRQLSPTCWLLNCSIQSSWSEPCIQRTFKLHVDWPCLGLEPTTFFIYCNCNTSLLLPAAASN